MGRAKKKRLPPFVPILREMMYHPAFKALSNAARTCYIYLKLDQKGPDQLRLCLSHSQGAQLMSKATFTRAMRELQETGFIRLIQHGGLYGGSTEYALDEAWRLSTAEDKPGRRVRVKNDPRAGVKNDPANPPLTMAQGSKMTP